MKLLIVGYRGGTHVGASLERAASRMGLDYCFLDPRPFTEAPRWVRAFHWKLRDRRAPGMRRFETEFVRRCRASRPEVVVATGTVPLGAGCLEEAAPRCGRIVNFVTDDPWNPSHRSSWFLSALSRYSEIYTPRRSNVPDLEALGCRRIVYLPFGYDPDLFYPEPPESDERTGYEADVFFAGGADAERRPILSAIVDAGFRVALYGDYWEKIRELARYARGAGDPSRLRRSIAAAKVCLCLVRRANRDGHSMRSFEVPAAGGCLLTEDTDEHREIFGQEGACTLYFRSTEEMLAKLRRLTADEPLRRRLAAAAHRRIVDGPNTYEARLSVMAGLAGESPANFSPASRGGA